MQNLHWSRTRIINGLVFLSVLFVAVVLVREFEEILRHQQNGEIRSLVTSIGVAIVSYLVKATDANRQSIKDLHREIEEIKEQLDLQRSTDEKQQEKLVRLETQLATQDKYWQLREKLEKLSIDTKK